MNIYLEAINEIANNYDAFFITNKYGGENGTHVKEFKLLEDLIPKGDKVINALSWIKNEYDCYYKNDIDTNNGPFEYLRNIVKEKSL